MKTQLIDRWIIEITQPDSSHKHYPLEAISEHYSTMLDAISRRDILVEAGLDVQLYHERHVLLKEPHSWTHGKRTSE